MFATLYKPLSESAPTWAAAKITDIFKIISYNYTKKFYEVGSFSMVIPVNELSAELLETNTFLATSDGDYLFVTDIKETESRITLEGHDLKYLLAGRITLFPTEEQDKGTYGYYVTKGNTGECICDIVRHNITEATDPDRRIYGFSVNYSPFGLQNDTYMTRLEPLDQVVGTLCKNAGIGYDVTMRFDPAFGDSIAFQVLNPTDRSADQTDVPKMIFSTSFLNVESLLRETGVNSEKNAIYAINGTNIDDAVVKLVNRDEDKASFGVYRRETTVNVNCDIDEIDSYALKEAEDFITTDSFVMDVMAVESYKRDWFVGDIVTFQHKGVRRNVPIIAAEVQRTADKFTVKLSAGETVAKPVTAISKKADRVAEEITQKKFDDGYVTVVKELPEKGKKNKIYVLEEEQAAALADDSGTEEVGSGSDTVNGFVFIGGEWKMIGGEGGGAAGSGVGEFTNEEKNSEIFNSYKDITDDNGAVTSKKNYINPNTQYAHISGASNSIDNDESVTLFSNWASILGGDGNSINNSFRAVICGGMGNKIEKSSYFSAILGGNGNLISSAMFALAAGTGNKVYASQSVILDGAQNQILAGASNSVIGAGNTNKISGRNSGIFCGSINTIETGGGDNAIIAGNQNRITNGNQNLIGAGVNNNISANGIGNCIICGYYNEIKERTDYAAAVGMDNILINSSDSFVCGYRNEAYSTNCIICGNNNKSYVANSIVCGNGAEAAGNELFIVGNGGNVFWVDNTGTVYAREYKIIGAEGNSEVATFSAKSSDNPDLSELTAQISEIKADIEALRAENAALKAEIAALK